MRMNLMIATLLAGFAAAPQAHAWDWPWNVHPKPMTTAKECPDGYVELRNGTCLDEDEWVNREMQRTQHEVCDLHQKPTGPGAAGAFAIHCD
jgi:hypothetical protein